MDKYITITLKPDAEMPVNRLLNSVYIKLHKALHDLQNSSIGVSFPSYQLTLGHVIRLHGNEVNLDKLQKLNWLGGMMGYCEISDILPVPDTAQFRNISRIQTTMSQSKLKRLIKRGSITEAEVKDYKAKMFSQGLDNPYVELESISNGHRHRRYLAFGQLQSSPTEGTFDTFGLSKTATIPWF